MFMEVSSTWLSLLFLCMEINRFLDLHLANILLRVPPGFHGLSQTQIYDQFGEPDPQPVVRNDGESRTAHVPSNVYEAIWMGKPTEELTLDDAKLILIDFGVAFNPSQEQRLNSCAPIDIRPPETRFEPTTPLTFASDIWSLACAIWNLLAQRPIFGEILATPDIITSQQVISLGRLPTAWWHKWETRRNFFAEDGTPIESRRTPSWDTSFERDIQQPRREQSMGALDDKEAAAFTGLLRSMLAYKPEDRPTTKEILESEWMKEYALPEYEKSITVTSACNTT